MDVAIVSLTPTPYDNFNTLLPEQQDKISELVRLLTVKLDLTARQIFRNLKRVENHLENWRPLFRIFKKYEDKRLEEQITTVCKIIDGIQAALEHWLDKLAIDVNMRTRTTSESTQEKYKYYREIHRPLEKEIPHIENYHQQLLIFLKETHRLNTPVENLKKTYPIVTAIYDISLDDLKADINDYCNSNKNFEEGVERIQSLLNKLQLTNKNFVNNLNKLLPKITPNLYEQVTSKTRKEDTQKDKISTDPFFCLPTISSIKINKTSKNTGDIIKSELSLIVTNEEVNANIKNLFLQVMKKSVGEKHFFLDDLDKILFHVEKWPPISETENPVKAPWEKEAKVLLELIAKVTESIKKWNSYITPPKHTILKGIKFTPSVDYRNLKTKYALYKKRYEEKTKIIADITEKELKWRERQVDLSQSLALIAQSHDNNIDNSSHSHREIEHRLDEYKKADLDIQSSIKSMDIEIKKIKILLETMKKRLEKTFIEDDITQSPEIELRKIKISNSIKFEKIESPIKIPRKEKDVSFEFIDVEIQSPRETEPSPRLSSETEPSTESSSETEPSTESSSETEPSTESSSETEPSTESSSETEPSTESSSGEKENQRIIPETASIESVVFE